MFFFLVDGRLWDGMDRGMEFHGSDAFGAGFGGGKSWAGEGSRRIGARRVFFAGGGETERAATGGGPATETCAPTAAEKSRKYKKR